MHTPETPGSIHEGGELGYSLSHGFGAAFDNPDLIVTVVVGDGEAETGPLATSWHSNKFLNPIHDGAVLPVLHLNGYKIANPTILARISREELESLFRGYGWTPYVVEGDDPELMHQQMAGVMEHCVLEIRDIQQKARSAASGEPVERPAMAHDYPCGRRRVGPCPKEIDGHKLEGSWRSHQMPILDPVTNPAHLALVESWLRSYKPEDLFDEHGTPIAELKELAPRRPTQNQRQPLTPMEELCESLSICRTFVPMRSQCRSPDSLRSPPTETTAHFLCEVMRRNMTNFRVFGPDETASNKLDAIYEASGKTWMAAMKPEDADGGFLSTDGRVMEMLSEHTLEGWFEGYVPHRPPRILLQL